MGRKSGASLCNDRCVLAEIPAQRCLARDNMWSTHSRRIDPISRSAKPLCQGEAGAVGLSRMPMARNRRVTRAPDPDLEPYSAEPCPKEKPRLSDVQPTPPSGWL